MQARPRPSVLSQEESRIIWKNFRKASADGRSIFEILRDIGVIKPYEAEANTAPTPTPAPVVWSNAALVRISNDPVVWKDEPAECCRAHLKILADMERMTGDPERRKRFKFCPECGRRSL